jgi:thioredoxin 1
MSGGVLELGGATFDEVVQSGDLPVVVEFWAPWCPPCTTMGPVLESVASEYGDRLLVVRINADEEPELARRYEVVSVPTFLVFRQGEVRNRMVGARSRSRLLEEIEAGSGSVRA